MIVTDNTLNIIYIYSNNNVLKLNFIELASELETWQYNASNVQASAISEKKIKKNIRLIQCIQDTVGRKIKKKSRPIKLVKSNKSI